MTDKPDRRTASTAVPAIVKTVLLPDEVARVGLFGDLHGSLTALLRLRKHRPDVEAWLCTGDAVDMGLPVHYNAPVLRALSRFNIPSVLGNHEARVLKEQERLLYEEARAYFSSIPRSLAVAWRGLQIRIFHATPESLEQNILPGKEMERTFQNVEGDVVVMGHTHIAFDVEMGGRRFVNPGALSTAEGAAYAVIETNGSFELESLP